MISYIKGQLTEITEGQIVVETQGVGFEINVPATVIDTLPHTGSEVKIYTYFRVSEDAMTLYGFNTRGDLEIFRQLIGVSGIGPKGALAILSTLRPDDLRMAIIAGDDKAIAKAPGIGAKTAQRIIIDLKDKVNMEDILSPGRASVLNTGSTNSNACTEAIEALVALGYSASQAARAARSVEDSDNAEDILKAALKLLM